MSASPTARLTAAITNPTPNMSGCRKLTSSMIASWITIQIIWPQPIANARNGRQRIAPQPHRGDEQRAHTEQSAEDQAGTRKSLNGLPARIAVSMCMTLPSGRDQEGRCRRRAPRPRGTAGPRWIPSPRCRGQVGGPTRLARLGSLCVVMSVTSLDAPRTGSPRGARLAWRPIERIVLVDRAGRCRSARSEPDRLAHCVVTVTEPIRTAALNAD